MREEEFVGTGGGESAWDEVVALDPEDAAAIRIDPEIDDFAPPFPEFDPDPHDEGAEPEFAEEDPDFDDDAEISLLLELGIDLDAPDGPVGAGLGLDFGLGLDLEPEPYAEDAPDDEVAA